MKSAWTRQGRSAIWDTMAAPKCSPMAEDCGGDAGTGAWIEQSGVLERGSKTATLHPARWNSRIGGLVQDPSIATSTLSSSSRR
eukprot:7949341-Pyramimonas_sp.AAC.1